MSFVKKFYSTIKGLWYTQQEIKRIARQVSCYPEKPRKSEKERVKDLRKWFWKNHTINNYYNAYGMDIVGVDINDCLNEFVDERWFFKDIYRKNKKGSVYSQIVLLKDKLLFSKFMKEAGINTPEVIAVVVNKVLCDLEFNKIEINSVDFSDCFIKDVGGECASFVKKIENNQDLEKCINNECGKNMYIIQKRVYQHKLMSDLYSDSVNTLRIVTVKEKTDSEPYVLTLLLRVGTHTSGNVDNWAAGGLVIGIDENNCLKHDGYYKPMYGIKTSKHPDSKIDFLGYEIPYLNEAKDLVIKAHKSLYNMFAIGWDVAITEDGPCIIEGNDNWEISLQQVVDRPLGKEWDDAITN